jgi:hypothetical protein
VVNESRLRKKNCALGKSSGEFKAYAPRRVLEQDREEDRSEPAVVSTSLTTGGAGHRGASSPLRVAPKLRP